MRIGLLRESLSASQNFITKNFGFVVITSLIYFVAMFVLNSIPLIGLFGSWVLGLYAASGWMISFKNYRQGIQPEVDSFFSSYKITNEFLGNMIMSFVFLHMFTFVVMLLILILPTIALWPHIIAFLKVFAVPFMHGGQSTVDILKEYNPSSTSIVSDFSLLQKGFMGFAVFAFLIYCFVYSCMSKNLTAICINEKNSPYDNFRKSLAYFLKFPIKLTLINVLFSVMCVVFALLTCGLGLLVLSVAGIILSQNIYDEFNKESQIT